MMDWRSVIDGTDGGVDVEELIGIGSQNQPSIL